MSFKYQTLNNAIEISTVTAIDALDSVNKSNNDQEQIYAHQEDVLIEKSPSYCEEVI